MTGATGSGSTAEAPRGFQFPTAFSVLAIATLLVWIAVFFIPPGWYETNGVLIGGLALAAVGYDRYVRFMIPLLAILFVAPAAVVTLAAGWADR